MFKARKCTDSYLRLGEVFNVQHFGEDLTNDFGALNLGNSLLHELGSAYCVWGGKEDASHRARVPRIALLCFAKHTHSMVYVVVCP